MRLFIFVLIIFAINLSSVSAQFFISYDSEHHINLSGGMGDELKANLTTYFVTYRCAFFDSSFRENLIQSFCAEIINDRADYKGSNCSIREPFVTGRLKNIVFLTVPDPLYFNFSFNFAYNINQKKSYLLGKASLNDLMQMLETENFPLSTDGQILHYCQLITLLKNPSNYVYFVADIKQLMLEAASGPGVPFYDLKTVKRFKDIKIEMPTIDRNGKGIKVKYYAAIYNNVYEIKASISDGKMTAYDEKAIGTVPNWNGVDPRLW